MIKSLYILLFILLCEFSFSQNQPCNLEKSKSNEIYTVDGKEIVCLAKNSKKEKTLIFTFGIWCAPCIKHLPEAIKLADDYQLDFYVLLIDKEENNSLIKTINYLQNIKKDIKILVLKDSDGNRPNKKYKKFLAEITPSQFEDINGMSKYIVINNKGKVLMVTNWKDSRDNDWDDDSKMIEKRIIPILN